MVNGLDIDTASVSDNVDDRQIEFDAGIDGEQQEFAVRYDVLEALSGIFPLTDPVATFEKFAAQVAAIGPGAIERSSGIGRIVISETDLAASAA